MAKRTVNKSALVRDYILGNPDQGPSDIATALKRYKIKPGFVSNIKTKMRKDGLIEGGVGRRNGRRKQVSTSTDGIVAAARLIQLCGGVQEASEALKAADRVASLIGK